MLNVTLDKSDWVVMFQPDGKLTSNDIHEAETVINLCIGKNGVVNGLIIHFENLSVWRPSAILYYQIKFIRKYHQYITRIAIVTNSRTGSFAAYVGSRMVNAEIRRFPFHEIEYAKKWIYNCKQLAAKKYFQ
jgi:hypothetical protein